MKSFAELRPRLEKQYEQAHFVAESGWSEAHLREAAARIEAEHPGESRCLNRARLVRLVLDHAPVALEPWNPVAGKFRDFGLLEEDVRRWTGEAEKRDPEFRCWTRDMEYGIGYMVDRSHVAPDWKSVLTLGIPGLLERARRGTADFHRSVVIAYEGLAEFCRRAGKLNANAALEAVADHAPRTLHEAFQLAYVVHDAIEYTGEEVRTMGRFDELYLDFYRNDLAAGRLTRESAKELLKCFWIAFYARYQGTRFGKNFCFGPEFNELSYLGMEAYHEMNTVDPKLSVLVRADMPQEFAELYARNIRDGRNAIVSLNYDVVVSGLIRHGRTPEDARNFIPIGCYEPAVAGKEVSLSGATMLMLPISVRHVLLHGEKFASFDEFKAACYRRLGEAVAKMTEGQRRCERMWPLINPTPLLSGTFESCIRNGKDITAGGAEYNTTGCVISYLADAVDSLAAVEHLVFREKLCTLAELRDAVERDWNGFEKLRRTALARAPKWGNNDDRADRFGVELSDLTSELLFRLPNGRGGTFFPSLYGQLVVEIGALVGALPSGRRAGEPVSKNMDACLSMDRNGITALMNSVLKVDMTGQPCGTCLDLMLHPSSVKGEEGIRNMVTLIRVFIAQGGSGLQFNIFDAETLRDARRNPEKYANLQVRVCGWNVRFTDLTPEAQETFIRQAENPA